MACQGSKHLNGVLLLLLLHAVCVKGYSVTLPAAQSVQLEH
jgi:hypothetical protein